MNKKNGFLAWDVLSQESRKLHEKQIQQICEDHWKEACSEADRVGQKSLPQNGGVEVRVHD